MHRAYLQGIAMPGALERRIIMRGISLHQVAVNSRSSDAALGAGVTGVPPENAADGKHQHVSIQRGPAWRSGFRQNECIHG